MLYVPVEQMDIVQKYIGGDSASPRINKLSGGEWKAIKARAKAAIAVFAKDLIDLYAHRKMEKGHAFEKDTVWQKEFRGQFPLSGDRRSAAFGRGDQERYGEAFSYGQTSLRRRGVWQD